MEFNQKEYLKWKRNNITYRGVKGSPYGVDTSENDGGAMLGRGLYTAALSNKSLAKEYGDVYFVYGGIPKNPKVFNNLNEWEMFFYNTLVFNFSKEKGKEHPDRRDFDAKTSIEKEMLKMGYDGIVIKGRETVNYTPDDVRYFKNENDLIEFYKYVISENRLDEGLSKILYHGTNYKTLGIILSENILPLTLSLDGHDSKYNKGKTYFLSTQRSKPTTGYLFNKHVTTILELDGDKLANNFKGTQVDYWGMSKKRSDYDSEGAYKGALLSKELEDRIISNKSEIENIFKYIIRLHVAIEENTNISFNVNLLKENQNRIVFYKSIEDMKRFKNAVDYDALSDTINDATNDQNERENQLRAMHVLPDILALIPEKKNELNKYFNEEEILFINRKISEIDYDLTRLRKYGKWDQYIGGGILSDLLMIIRNNKTNPNPIVREFFKYFVLDYKKTGSSNLRDYMIKKLNLKQEIMESNNNAVSFSDLQKLEKYLDEIFSTVGVDINFTKHFSDRMNDPRNGKPITIDEIRYAFKEVYKFHKDKLIKNKDRLQAVIKSLSTKINLPFVLEWDYQNNELDLVAKTVMRKDKFSTNNPVLKVNENMKKTVKITKSELKEMMIKKLSLKEDDHLNQDDESKMSDSQMDKIIEAASEIKNMVKEGDQLDAWVQSLISVAEFQLKTVRDYLSSESNQSETTPSDETESDI